MNKRDLFKTIILFFLIVGVTVGSAIALNLVTGPKIEADQKAREEAAAAQQAGDLLKVFPGATGFKEITADLTIEASSGVTAVYEETSGLGYAFIATKDGYSKPVTVTVGVNREGLITGIIAEIGAGDFPINDATINSFVGQDSTLSGVVLTGGATISSGAVKGAVEAGLTVLASNDLMKAAKKEIEQVFAEELEKIYGFIKGDDLTASGNITVAYKTLNKNIVVCYVAKGEEKLLALYNTSGVVAVYKANLVDEATQSYELVDVTNENADVVTEVSAFASAHVSSTFEKLSAKITRLYAEATEITEISVSTFGTISSAASFVVDGQTYYAYHSQPINGFEKDVMDVYVVLDSEGKICKTEALVYFYGHTEYFFVAQNFDKAGYEAGFNGLTNETFDGSQALIAGATYTQNSMKQAVSDVFAAFTSKGGNN